MLIFLSVVFLCHLTFLALEVCGQYPGEIDIKCFLAFITSNGL